MTSEEFWRLGLALAMLIAICVGILTFAGVRVRRDAVVSAVRAGIQLTLVALVIAWVFQHPPSTFVFLGVMVIVAAITSARRIGGGQHSRFLVPTILVAITVGALSAVGPVVASQVLPQQAETLLPFAAQLIGGSMTAASLVGVRLRDEVASRWGEVEGWLALGATDRQAVASLARNAIANSLIPALDQTKSAGLVVLPGAFVGLLLGGATPIEAAQVQLLVLVGLLAAQSVCAVVTAYFLGPWLVANRPWVRDR